MGRCPLTHTGALLHIPSTLQPAFKGLVPSHSNGQDWKIWLSGQTNHHGQLNINPILLHIIAPDIRTGARLLWNYLLYAQDTTPSPNPNGPPGTTISKFPLRALFTNIIGCWSSNHKMCARYLSLLIVISQNKGGTYIISKLDGLVFNLPIAAFRVIPYFARQHIDIPPLDRFINISTH